MWAKPPNQSIEEIPFTSGVPNDVSGEGNQSVFFMLGDHLGSTSVVLDKFSSELVERTTYQAYGTTESDYRPAHWGGFRSDYRFTGKEEDSEVGLVYFPKRYLNTYLQRWVSADPLAVHSRQADPNAYAYVGGAALKNTDPLGLDVTEQDIVDAEVAGGNTVEDSARAREFVSGQSAPDVVLEEDTIHVQPIEDKKAAEEQWRAQQESNGVRAGVLHFVGAGYALRPLPQNPTLPTGLQELNSGVQEAALDGATALHLNTLDLAVRVETTALAGAAVLPGAIAAAPGTVGLSLLSGGAAAGVTTLTSEGSPLKEGAQGDVFDLARDVHGAGVGGAVAGAIGFGGAGAARTLAVAAEVSVPGLTQLSFATAGRQALYGFAFNFAGGATGQLTQDTLQLKPPSAERAIIAGSLSAAGSGAGNLVGGSNPAVQGAQGAFLGTVLNQGVQDWLF